MRTLLSAALAAAVAGGLLVGVSDGAVAAKSNHRPGHVRISNASLAEDATSGTVVGRLSAPDKDAKHIHRFRLAEGKGSADNALFAVRGARLVLTGALDFETKTEVSVRVRVTDKRGATRATPLRIEVRDVADQPPTDLTLSGASVAENRPAGTVVGALATVDPDAEDTFTYAVLSGSDFQIAGDQLVTAAPLDFEASASRTVRVQSTAANGDTIEKDLTVSVTDVNEAPTGITLSPDSVREGLVAAIVGTLSAGDPDAGDTHSFALVAGAGDADNGRFTVSGATVRTTSALDYEAQPTYSIRVRATDAAGLTHEQVLNIASTDVDETPPPAPPATTLTDIWLTHDAVDENQADMLVGQLESDGTGVTYAFAMLGRRAPASPFSLSPTGELRTTDAFDFESMGAGNNTRHVYVQATDGAGKSVTEKLTVTINDVNEAPYNLTLSNSTLKYGVDHSVGNLDVSDPDDGDTHTYSILDDLSGYLVVDGTELMLAACSSPSPGSYPVTVKVVDAGGLEAQKTFTITMIEPPARLAKRC